MPLLISKAHDVVTVMHTAVYHSIMMLQSCTLVFYSSAQNGNDTSMHTIVDHNRHGDDNTIMQRVMDHDIRHNDTVMHTGADCNKMIKLSCTLL